MRLEYRQNAEAVVVELEDVAERAIDTRDVLEAIGERMVEYSIPENFRVGGRPDKWPGSKWRSGHLMRESSRLINSITFEIKGGHLKVGTNAKYAAQRHFGGDIRPRTARALAIPLPGMPRSMRRPKRWGDRLFYLEPQKKKPDTVGILATRDNRTTDGKVTARFILRSKVTQPARPFLLWQDDDRQYAEQELARHVTGDQ